MDARACVTGMNTLAWQIRQIQVTCYNGALICEKDPCQAPINTTQNQE
jgi:hypothetical protein